MVGAKKKVRKRASSIPVINASGKSNRGKKSKSVLMKKNSKKVLKKVVRKKSSHKKASVILRKPLKTTIPNIERIRPVNWVFLLVVSFFFGMCELIYERFL